MKPKLLYYLFAVIIAIFGIFLMLLASDLNPLLALDSSQQWINFHFYSKENGYLNILIAVASYSLGAIMLGTSIAIIRWTREIQEAKTKKRH